MYYNAPGYDKLNLAFFLSLSSAHCAKVSAEMIESFTVTAQNPRFRGGSDSVWLWISGVIFSVLLAGTGHR